MTRKRKAMAVGLVLVLALAMGGCKGFLEFTEKVAAENGHFANAVIIAHKDGFVDDATERTLLEASRTVAKDDDAAVDAYVSQDKPGALAKIDATLATIDTDVANGVLGIKNPQKQLEIKAIVAALRSLVITAKAYVQGAR